MPPLLILPPYFTCSCSKRARSAIFLKEASGGYNKINEPVSLFQRASLFFPSRVRVITITCTGESLFKLLCSFVVRLENLLFLKF